MAAQAEAIQTTSPDNLEQPELVPGLLDADSIPELNFTRRRAAHQASELLQTNRNLVIEGELDAVPLPVDALGTAAKLARCKHEFGESSAEYADMKAGLVLDCDRLLAEAYRKNTWEIFPEAEQKLDPETGEYTANGISLLDISKRGLSPLAETEERDRRANEYVEEYGYHAIPKIQALGRLGVHMETEVRVQTISECTDWAIKAYESNSRVSHGGYVPGIKKLKIRSMRFTGSGDRWQEEVAVSGLYITHEVIEAVLKDEGVLGDNESLTKTELHGKQFINTRGEGALGIVIKLDQKASEITGKNIFMGEEVAENHKKNYDVVVAESEARQAARVDQSLILAEHMIRLESKKTDKWVAEGIIDNLVKDMLLGVAKQNPDLAEEMFDKKTADGFREVARLRRQGYHQEADRLEQKVAEEAPAASYCGAGSCGLESVLSGSVEDARAERLGLRGKKLHDKERACPKCKQKKIYYDQEANKACVNCGHRQIKGHISNGSSDSKSK